MKISARNVLEGKVKSIERGAVNAYVTIETAGGAELVSMVSHEALDRLGLSNGDEAYAVIDAASVMVGIPHGKR